MMAGQDAGDAWARGSPPARRLRHPASTGGVAINVDDKVTNQKKRKPLSRRPTHTLLASSDINLPPPAVASSRTGSPRTRTSTRFTNNAQTHTLNTPSSTPSSSRTPIVTAPAPSSSSPNIPTSSSVPASSNTNLHSTRKSSRLVAKRKLERGVESSVVPVSTILPCTPVTPIPAQLKKHLLTPSTQPVPRKRRRGDVADIDVLTTLPDTLDGSELERDRGPRHSARLENKIRNKRKLVDGDNAELRDDVSIAFATEKRNRRLKAQPLTGLKDTEENLINEKKSIRPQAKIHYREPLVARNYLQSSEISPNKEPLSAPSPRTRSRKRQRLTSSPKIEPACADVIDCDIAKLQQEVNEHLFIDPPPLVRVSVEADSDASDETLIDSIGPSKVPCVASIEIDGLLSSLSPLSELSSLSETDEPAYSPNNMDVDDIGTESELSREGRKGSLLSAYGVLADVTGPNPLVVVYEPQPDSGYTPQATSKPFRNVFLFPHPAYPPIFYQWTQVDSFNLDGSLKSNHSDSVAPRLSRKTAGLVLALMVPPSCLAYRIHQRQCLLAKDAGRPWGALPLGMLFSCPNTRIPATGVNQVNVLIALLGKGLGERVKAKQAAARMQYHFGSLALKGATSIAPESCLSPQERSSKEEGQMGMADTLSKLLTAGLIGKIARKQKEGMRMIRGRGSARGRGKERGKWRKNERRVASAWVERVFKELRKDRKEKQKPLDQSEDDREFVDESSSGLSAEVEVEVGDSENIQSPPNVKSETEVTGLSLDSDAKLVTDTIEEDTKHETEICEIREFYVPLNPRGRHRYSPSIPTRLRQSVSIISSTSSLSSEFRVLEGEELRSPISRSSSSGSSLWYEEDLSSINEDDHENDENENLPITTGGMSPTPSLSPTSPTSPETPIPPGPPMSILMFPKQQEQNWHARHRFELPVWKCASLSRVEQSCQIYGVDTVRAAIASEAATYANLSGSPIVPSSPIASSSQHTALESSSLGDHNHIFCENACNLIEEDTVSENDADSDADGEYEIDLEYEGYEEYASNLRNISIGDDDFESLDNIEGIEDEEWDDIDMDTIEMNENDPFYSSSDDDSDDDDDSIKTEDEKQEGESAFQLEIEAPAQPDVGGAEFTFAIKSTLPESASSPMSSSSITTPLSSPSPSDSYLSVSNPAQNQLYDPDFFPSSPPYSPGSNTCGNTPVPSLSALSALSRIPALCLRDTMQPIRGLGTPDSSCGAGRRAWLEAAEAVDASRRARETVGIEGQLLQHQEQPLHSQVINGVDNMNSMNAMHVCQPLQPLQQMQTMHTLEQVPMQSIQDMQPLLIVDPMVQPCGHHDQAHAFADNMFWGLLGFNVGVGVGMGIGMGVGMGMQHSLPHPHPIIPVSSLNTINPLNPMAEDFEMGVGGFETYGASGSMANVACSPCTPSSELEAGMPVPVPANMGLHGCMTGEIGTGTSEFANVFGAEDENRERSSGSCENSTL